MINMPLCKCLLAALSVLSCVNAVAPSTAPGVPFDATAKIDPKMSGGRALGTAPAPSLEHCKKNKDKKTCTMEEEKRVKRNLDGSMPSWFSDALSRARDRSTERELPHATEKAFARIERIVAQTESAHVDKQKRMLVRDSQLGSPEAAKGGRYWSTGHHVEQTTYYARVAASPAIHTICEVGFNAGHSTVTWLNANPSARVFSFDANFTDYSWRCMRAMQETFGERLHFTIGPSQLTIARNAPMILDLIGNGRGCDLLHVDGDHSELGAYADFYHFFSTGLARCNETLILMDDVCDPQKRDADDLSPSCSNSSHSYVSRGGPSRALHKMEREKLVRVLDMRLEKLDRGWALVAPVCTSAAQWPTPCKKGRVRIHTGRRNKNLPECSK